jgi:hypothetical protein
MQYPECPSLQWLGYGVDLTTVTPLDVTAASTSTSRILAALLTSKQLSKSVRRFRQIIEIDPDANTRLVDIGALAMTDIPNTQSLTLNLT